MLSSKWYPFHTYTARTFNSIWKELRPNTLISVIIMHYGRINTLICWLLSRSSIFCVDSFRNSICVWCTWNEHIKAPHTCREWERLSVCEQQTWYIFMTMHTQMDNVRTYCTYGLLIWLEFLYSLYSSLVFFFVSSYPIVFIVIIIIRSCYCFFVVVPIGGEKKQHTSTQQQ